MRPKKSEMIRNVPRARRPCLKARSPRESPAPYLGKLYGYPWDGCDYLGNLHGLLGRNDANISCDSSPVPEGTFSSRVPGALPG